MFSPHRENSDRPNGGIRQNAGIHIWLRNWVADSNHTHVLRWPPFLPLGGKLFISPSLAAARGLIQLATQGGWKRGTQLDSAW